MAIKTYTIHQDGTQTTSVIFEYSTVTKKFNTLASTKVSHSTDDKVKAAIWILTNWESVEKYSENRSAWVYTKAIKKFAATQASPIAEIFNWAIDNNTSFTMKQLNEILEIVETGITARMACNLTI